MKKAVVFFADGTEECEALLVVDLLRRANVQVTVASASGRLELETSHGIRMTADALAEDLDYTDTDLVVLPGGIPGTPNLAANPAVTAAVTACAKAGKKVAAICAAPSILAQLGLLEGKQATAQPVAGGDVAVHYDLLVQYGSTGQLVLEGGVGGAIPFALELVRQLAGEQEAQRVQQAIAYRH